MNFAADTPPILSVEGARAVLRLNRAAVHNRLTPEDVRSIRAAVGQMNEDPAIRVLVLTGTGKSFSSGFNLGALAATAPGDEGNEFEAMTDAVENARMVTVARLNGPVYGGATDLALACDFRIGVTHARMFMPAARLGLQYYGHAMRRWVSRLGLGAAKKLFLTAREIDAAEMLRIGFLDEAVPAEQLDAVVDALVSDLLAMAPIPLAGLKQALNQAARDEYDDEGAQRGYRRSLASRDFQEGLAAFAEKRRPVFRGD
jgi:enoyl-CoA hydratase